MSPTAKHHQSIMGSLPCMPAPSPVDQTTNHLIFLSFCSTLPPSSDTGNATAYANWMESYDPSTNSFSHVGSIPGIPDNYVLKDFRMVPVGRSVFIIGGRYFPREARTSGAEEETGNIRVSGKVLRYDVTTTEWITCTPLGTPRFDFSCAAHDGRIYVAGGRTAQEGKKGLHGVSSAEVYDPSEDRWDPLPGMATLRYKSAMVSWRERVHVVGGFAEREGSSDPAAVTFGMERSSAEAYDSRSQSWELKPGMWPLDVPPNQIVAIGDRLFSSGDCLSAWKGHLEAFDGKENIWNIVEGSQRQMPEPAGEEAEAFRRVYLTMAPVGSRLYFISGYRAEDDGARAITAVHSFDTAVAAEEAWNNLPPVQEGLMDKEMCCHCCVVRVA